MVILLFHIFINSEHFSMYLQNVQTSSSDHPGSYSMHSRVLFQGKSGQGMMLTTHLHPAARLRMSGAIPVWLHGVDRHLTLPFLVMQYMTLYASPGMVGQLHVHI